MTRLLQGNRWIEAERQEDCLNAAMRSIGTGAVLDVETTGFSPDSEEIIELAITIFRYDRVNGEVVALVSKYAGLREPHCRITRAASAVHGITRRTVKGLDLNYRRIRGMLREAEFVISHYAAFDRAFVGRLIPSSRNKTWLCSRDGIDWPAKGFSVRSLEELAIAHDIENECAHRAASDVSTLLELLAHRRRRRKSYLYDLLRNAHIIRPLRRKAKLPRGEARKGTRKARGAAE